MPSPREPAEKVPIIRETLVIAASPQEVFKALTDPAHLLAWSGQDGAVEPRVGGEFQMFDGGILGTVMEYDPPRKLSYTWREAGWPQQWRDSLVVWNLEPHPQGTRVELSHSNLPDHQSYQDHSQGWKAYFLEPLTQHLSDRLEPLASPVAPVIDPHQRLVQEIARRVDLLPKPLVQHIQQVRQQAQLLAQRFQLDQAKVDLAALGHDIARATEGQSLIAKAREFDLPLHPLEEALPVLLHGPVGAQILKRELGLRDRDILEAVRCHTTGAPRMGPLAQAIFLADKLDPHKAQRYPFIEKVRRKAQSSLREALLEFFDQELQRFIQQGLLIHPAMVEARNWLLQEAGGLENLA